MSTGFIIAYISFVIAILLLLIGWTYGKKIIGGHISPSLQNEKVSSKFHNNLQTGANIGGIISAVISLFFFVLTIINHHNEEPKNIVSTTIINNPAQSLRAHSFVQYHPDSSKKVKLLLVLTKSVGIQILIANDEHNDNLSLQLISIIKNKGYNAVIAQKEQLGFAISRFVSGRLIISKPEETTGAFNMKILNYDVSLDLETYIQNNSNPCNKVVFHANVPGDGSDTMEKIRNQGFAEILNKIRLDNSINFCN